jgi:8-hydroxy-5-deazaflavin:NADPH oxidoreductase
VKIAILGGTGSFGRPLATRLKDAGYDVLVGSRDAERGREAGAELGVGGGSNEDVVRDADLVVLAVKAEGALDTARELAEAIGATPVLSVASHIRFTKEGVLPDPDAASLAERVQAVVAAPVVAGLHSVAAATLGDEEPPDEDALVCGDDAGAKALVLEVAAKVCGRAVDAGPLASARALEGLTAVIVNVNKRYKAHAGIRVTGLQ